MLTDTIKAKGITGQIEVSNGVINITREGLRAKLSQGKKGELAIPVNHVTQVGYKKASFLTNGHIHFLLEGEKEGSHSILNCPMTVMFNRKQEAEFERIAELVTKLKEEVAKDSKYEGPQIIDYELVHFSKAGGNGYVVQRIRDKQKLSHWSLPISEGLYAFDVAGTSYRKQALQDSAFSPGRRLAIIPEPNNPEDSEALAVWDLTHRLHIGYMPKDCSPKIKRRIIDGEGFTYMSMWENREGKVRLSLRVLVIGTNAKIKLPNK